MGFQLPTNMCRARWHIVCENGLEERELSVWPRRAHLRDIDSHQQGSGKPSIPLPHYQCRYRDFDACPVVCAVVTLFEVVLANEKHFGHFEGQGKEKRS